jgi:hypothetical protein
MGTLERSGRELGDELETTIGWYVFRLVLEQLNHSPSMESAAELTPSNTFGSVDVNLAWDPLRTRFVFTAVAQDRSTSAFNIYYGWSNDSSGSSWTVSSNVVFAGSSDQSLKWDYPSIGVNANGWVIIGAVKVAGTPPSGVAVGYFTAVSTNGMDFSGPSCVAGWTLLAACPVLAPRRARRVVW